MGSEENGSVHALGESENKLRVEIIASFENEVKRKFAYEVRRLLEYD